MNLTETLYITRSNMLRIGCLLCAFCLMLSLSVYLILRSSDERIQAELEERVAELEGRLELDGYNERLVRDEPTYAPLRTPLYSVGLYGDRVAVFDAQSGKVLRVFEVRSETLPALDLRLLGEGIAVYTDADLCAVIADYTG